VVLLSQRPVYEGMAMYQYQDSADIKLDREVELRSVSQVIQFSPTHRLKIKRRLSLDRDAGGVGDDQPIDSPDTRSYLFASTTPQLNLHTLKDTSRTSWNQVRPFLCWEIITPPSMCSIPSPGPQSTVPHIGSLHWGAPPSLIKAL